MFPQIQQWKLPIWSKLFLCILVIWFWKGGEHLYNQLYGGGDVDGDGGDGCDGDGDDDDQDNEEQPPADTGEVVLPPPLSFFSTAPASLL